MDSTHWSATPQIAIDRSGEPVCRFDVKALSAVIVTDQGVFGHPDHAERHVQVLCGTEIEQRQCYAVAFLPVQNCVQWAPSLLVVRIAIGKKSGGLPANVACLDTGVSVGTHAKTEASRV